MSLEPPSGYVSIGAALEWHDANKRINVFGVVVDSTLPKKSRGTDFILTFNLHDGTTVASSRDALKIRVFKRSEEILPRIENVGDVVAIKSLKMTHSPQYGSIAISNAQTEVIVFFRDQIPDITLQSLRQGSEFPCYIMPGSQPPTLLEKMYAMSLKKSVVNAVELQSWISIEHTLTWTSKYAQITGKNMRGIGSNSKEALENDMAVNSKSIIDKDGERINYDTRFRFVKDIGPEQFVDLVGEVVKIFPGTMAADLYITDYTSNNMLYNHKDVTTAGESQAVPREGDEFSYIVSKPGSKWPGPYGTMTLAVNLWPPHSHFALRNVKVGDLVYLRNVRTKISKAQKIEGHLDGDYKYPEKVNIRVLTSHDPKVAPVKEYKAQYMKSIAEINSKQEWKQQANNKKKRSSKNKKAQEKAEAEKKYHQVLGVGMNKHVECGFLHIKLSTIGEILDNPNLKNRSPKDVEYSLPFLNAKYRAHVRVVDYFPRDLRDFSHALSDADYNDVIVRRDKNVIADFSHDSDGGIKWEWGFYLLVEDATATAEDGDSPRLQLLVASDGAEGLLRLDASDLREDPQALSALRERLFILWGNLEELKSAETDTLNNEMMVETSKASSISFECCIQEYGVLKGNLPEIANNWKRMHRIFGTTIM